MLTQRISKTVPRPFIIFRRRNSWNIKNHSLFGKSKETFIVAGVIMLIFAITYALIYKIFTTKFKLQ
jgi:hypothetical protein